MGDLNLRTLVTAVVVAGALVLTSACGGDDDGGGDDAGSTTSSTAATATTAPTSGSSEPARDASEIETWIAEVYLVGHDIGDYTGCLADAVTEAAEDEIPQALTVESNAELNTAYQVAPALMDALIEAQREECAALAD